MKRYMVVMLLALAMAGAGLLDAPRGDCLVGCGSVIIQPFEDRDDIEFGSD